MNIEKMRKSMLCCTDGENWKQNVCHWENVRSYISRKSDKVNGFVKRKSNLTDLEVFVDQPVLLIKRKQWRFYTTCFQDMLI